jgi:hypothetical protein
MDCDFEVRAVTVEEILRNAAEHAMGRYAVTAGIIAEAGRVVVLPIRSRIVCGVGDP